MPLLLVHVVDSNLNGSPVSLQLLHLGELHNSGSNVAQTVGRQVGAGDVLLEGAEVNTRVLLGEAIRRCDSLTLVNAKMIPE